MEECRYRGSTAVGGQHHSSVVSGEIRQLFSVVDNTATDTNDHSTGPPYNTVITGTLALKGDVLTFSTPRGAPAQCIPAYHGPVYSVDTVWYIAQYWEDSTYPSVVRVRWSGHHYLLEWPPYGIGHAIIFLPCGFFLSFFMVALCNRADHNIFIL